MAVLKAMAGHHRLLLCGGHARSVRWPHRWNWRDEHAVRTVLRRRL